MVQTQKVTKVQETRVSFSKFGIPHILSKLIMVIAINRPIAESLILNDIGVPVSQSGRLCADWGGGNCFLASVVVPAIFCMEGEG